MCICRKDNFHIQLNNLKINNFYTVSKMMRGLQILAK